MSRNKAIHIYAPMIIVCELMACWAIVEQAVAATFGFMLAGAFLALFMNIRIGR